MYADVDHRLHEVPYIQRSSWPHALSAPLARRIPDPRVDRTKQTNMTELTKSFENLCLQSFAPSTGASLAAWLHQHTETVLYLPSTDLDVRFSHRRTQDIAADRSAQ